MKNKKREVKIVVLIVFFIETFSTFIVFIKKITVAGVLFFLFWCPQGDSNSC